MSPFPHAMKYKIRRRNFLNDIISAVDTTILALLVAIIAFLYSSVGFGGATGYLAAMSFFNLPPLSMASTALILNVLVSSLSLYSYTRAGHFRLGLIWPFLATSLPAAFIGGYLKLNEQIYFILLYGVLSLVALRMLFFSANAEQQESELRQPAWLTACLVGAAIGLLSGMVGIGGGIFLSPVIILARWGSTRQASAAAAAFILLNSISGLVGRGFGGNLILDELAILLLPFGLVGGLLGSYWGARRFSSANLRRALGLVMAIAVLNYWFRLLG
jgi:uncharacterized membrane protein YfcA